MNMKAKKRILCACEEIGFEKYNVMITVPKEHPFGMKGLFDLDIDVAWAILNKNWQITFSRETLGKAIDDGELKSIGEPNIDLEKIELPGDLQLSA